MGWHVGLSDSCQADKDDQGGMVRGWQRSIPGMMAVCTLWMGGVASFPLLAASTVYPGETVRLVVPFSRGGASDLIFRDISTRARRELKSGMEVVNISGASAVRGTGLVRDAGPDGHTLLGTHQTLLHSYLSGKASYSHTRFTPVALLTRTVNIPSTWAGHSVQQADQIRDYVRSHPGDVRIGVIPDSTSDFFWLTLLSLVGIASQEVQFIHFPDTSAQIAALLAREIDFAMLDLASAQELYEQAALHPLAVAHTERLMRLPETATLHEQGIAMTHTSDRGVYAPKGTPRDRLERLAQAFGRALQDEELARHLEQDYGSFVDFRPLGEYELFLAQQLDELRQTHLR